MDEQPAGTLSCVKLINLNGKKSSDEIGILFEWHSQNIHTRIHVVVRRNAKEKSVEWLFWQKQNIKTIRR